MEAATRARWYVGIKSGLGASGYEAFRATFTPTPTTHGSQYICVWGPFYTKRGATWSAAHGWNNPHAQTVSEAERIARNEAP